MPIFKRNIQWINIRTKQLFLFIMLYMIFEISFQSFCLVLASRYWYVALLYLTKPLQTRVQYSKVLLFRPPSRQSKTVFITKVVFIARHKTPANKSIVQLSPVIQTTIWAIKNGLYNGGGLYSETQNPCKQEYSTVKSCYSDDYLGNQKWSF